MCIFKFALFLKNVSKEVKSRRGETRLGIVTTMRVIANVYDLSCFSQHSRDEMG